MYSSIAAVITAAGSSRRMGGRKKELCLLGDGPGESGGGSLTVLGKAVSAFASISEITAIVITVPPGGEDAARNALPPSLLENSGGPEILFVTGAESRRASVHRALSRLEALHPAYVLIHDGARPWVDAGLIRRIIAAAKESRAAIPLLPLTETPKETGEGGLVVRHLRRERIGAAQTPQGFAFPEILRAHEKAAEREKRDNIEYTDDAEVWGEFQGPVAAIPGEAANRKITFPEDLKTGNNSHGGGIIKTGIGRDLHRLVPGRRFLLGGVEIPSEAGELGHSDGDVLAHAVTDALLGAAALGDIGEFFSPSDPKWKDADSMELLRRAYKKVKDAGWRLQNLDCVVVCEKPKILPFREAVRASLAKALESPEEAVFVKGKTGEGLGPLGEGLAVEASAICLLCRAEEAH